MKSKEYKHGSTSVKNKRLILFIPMLIKKTYVTYLLRSSIETNSALDQLFII